MFVILAALILMAILINNQKFSLSDKICLRLPFSIYFGWVTVATIANITVFLVSINWSGWGISDQIWTILVLLIGMIIGVLRCLKDNNIPYIAVLIWAYSGILLKHISESEFSSQYPNIIFNLILSIVIFLVTIAWLTFKNRKISLSTK